MERKKIALYAFFAVAVLVTVFLPGFSELQRLREENEDAQKRIRMLRQHNDILKDEIRRMKQDPGYVEEKARGKLGIVKKGEFIYREEKK